MKLDETTIRKKLKDKNIEIVGDFIHLLKDTELKCNKIECGNVWIGKPKNYLYKNSCPRCSGKQRHTNEIIDEYLKNSNIIRLEDVKNNSTPIKWKCLIDGYEWFCRTGCLVKNGFNCPKCNKKMRITNEEIDERLKGTNIQRLSDYKNNNKEKMLWKCLIDGYEWLATWGMIDRRKGCPKCNKKIRVTVENIDERLIDRKIKRITKEVKNCMSVLTWKCEVCNNMWDASVNAILNNGTGCPVCKNKTEKIVKDIIVKNLQFDKFIHQKRFQFNNRNYYVDFYLENEDKKFVIEYNGKQHYEPIEYWGGERSFKKQQKRDEELREYCKNKNITLIEIHYKENDILSFLKERYEI